LRYAAASYRRQPWFALGALVILALATSLITVAFAFADAAFLRPWRVDDPSSVAILRTTPATPQIRDFRGISVAEFRYLREHARSMDVMFTMRSSTVDLADGARPLGRASTIYVSDNYLSALRIALVRRPRLHRRGERLSVAGAGRRHLRRAMARRLQPRSVSRSAARCGLARAR
jgi:hypothetical protein